VNEFKKIDKTGKGRITIEEATVYYNERFKELDRNGDGFLDVGSLNPHAPHERPIGQGAFEKA